MATASTELELSLSARARFDRSEGGLEISGRGCAVRLTAPSPVLVDALERLTLGGASEDALSAHVLDSGDGATLFSLLHVLRALDEGGLLRRRLICDGRVLATLIPGTREFSFEADPLLPHRVKLSRFCHLRAEHGVLRLESPLGKARLELEDARATAAALALVQPMSIAELEARCPDLGAAALAGLVVLLDNAAIAVDGDDPEAPDAPTASPAHTWEFHDLVFHMRSRRGRHDAGYGGTYRSATIAPLPLVEARSAGEVLALPRPELDRLRQADAPFTDVLERRRSIREYRAEPITVDELGEFLFRAARYQQVMPGEATSFALRPTPAGGALHELEIYPVVARCEGLAAGVYHYDPSNHALTTVAAMSPRVEQLLDEAWQTGNRGSPLQVYLQITARCQRVFWKYESMAYALILKNLGALYATMYLVATAMGLAPCALGGGDSELFASITGLDPCAEPAVGEFLLGARARS